jgi:hypothetical protein
MHKQLLISRRIDIFPEENAAVMMSVIWVLVQGIIVLSSLAIWHPVFDLEPYRLIGILANTLFMLSLAYIHNRLYTKVGFIKSLGRNARKCGRLLNLIAYFMIPILFAIMVTIAFCSIN